MQQLQKLNTNETHPTLWKVGQRGTAMAKALEQSHGSPAELEVFSNRLPSRIEDALDFPIVKELISMAGETSVKAYIEFELLKLANLVSVGGNLNNAQVVFIASELIRTFPNETLADFKLCFQRGAIGSYGEIYRLDGIVIRGWMEKYLEEKYQVAEKKLMDEKETYKEQYTWTGAAATLTDEVKQQQIKDRLQAWRAEIEKTTTHPNVPMTDEEIRKRGKASAYKSSYTAEYYALKDKIRREASEFYKDRYSYSAMKVWTVKDQEVFAETQADAEKIYQLATRQ